MKMKLNFCPSIWLMTNTTGCGQYRSRIINTKFHVVTEKGRVLGSKLCTLKGPVYSLFDGDNVELVHVAPHLVFDDFCDLDAWNKGNPKSISGRSVELKEFRLFMLEYMKNKGDAYCCSAKKAETRKW